MDKETENFKGQVFLDSHFSPNPTKTLIRDDNNWKAVKQELAKIKRLIKVRGGSVFEREGMKSRNLLTQTIPRSHTLSFTRILFHLHEYIHIHSHIRSPTHPHIHPHAGVQPNTQVQPISEKEKALVKLCSLFRRLDSAFNYDSPISSDGTTETYASLSMEGYVG